MSDTTVLDQLGEVRDTLQTLKTDLAALCEGRKAADMSDEDVAQAERYMEQIDFYQRREQALSKYESYGSGEQSQPRGRVSEPVERPDVSRSQALSYRRDPKCGFDDFGDFARAAINASGPRGGAMDKRLAQMAPTTYSNETSGPEGGYVVPPEFSSRVMEYVGDQNSLFARCDKTPVNSALAWPKDEDSPWSTSGPQAYWEAEGSQGTQSRVNLSQSGMKLCKLFVLCPVTDELLEDAPQLGAYLNSVISRRLRWKVDFAILQGTGVGMPLGILNSPCLKTVAKEGSQTADTINSTNILKMWSAMYGDFRGNGTWVYNQDTETQLMGMVVAGTSSDVPVFLPGGPYGSNFAGAPYSTLMGRPAVAHQACETLGDHGDIVFCDFSQYLIGYKTMGPNFATSMHLYFDYGMQAIRATWRLCGMPKWSTTIAARDGSATYSPFVSLAARA